jgi:thiol-disulfide isomerase/thioredoxin
MRITLVTRSLKNHARTLLLALALTQGSVLAQAATYRVGDIVTNFTLVARRPFTRADGTPVPAGARVHLSDFAGRVVFLEWFAVWCPYCVAAAPQVETGIVDWYAARGGNPFGVPVLHVAVNQEPRSVYQSQTDSFITQQGFGITMNDYDNTSTNKVRFMFQSSGQPIFVAINAVTNSPTHQPWQLLVNHLGYGATDFNQELANFRAIIDTVQPPASPPRLSAPHRVGSDFEFALQAQLGRTYRVQGSTNLIDWTTLRTLSGSTNSIVFRDTNAPPTRRFYRAVTP